MTEKLCIAIIKRAAQDYESALLGYNVGHKKAVDVVNECESFFRSEWYGMMTDVDGELLIKMIKDKIGGKL